MAIAQALTKDELLFLREQQNSELFRVIKKRLEWVYSLEAAHMASPSISDPTAVFRQQGTMQGILKSINYLTPLELFTENKKP